jgi:hypothetical protein
MLTASVFVGEQTSYYELPLQVLHRDGRDFMLVQALPRPQRVGPGAGYEGKCMSPALRSGWGRTGRDRHEGVKAGVLIGRASPHRWLQRWRPLQRVASGNGCKASLGRSMWD